MANASTTHLYAEHLRNIRCLSIQASLKTAANGQTAATLSADGNTLSLAHEGETATIRLPVAVPDHHNSATLRIPAVATRDLSFRLQIREDRASDCQLPDDGEQRPENILPWTARSLTTSSEIRCKKCHQVLVDRARVTIWKDLPSESWAEMMEFWHCHKPDVSGDHNHAGHKGFSADSVLALNLGVGMVNPIEFLLMKDDTRNIKVSKVEDMADLLACSRCNTTLGVVDSETGGFRLRKPFVSLSTNEDKPHVSFPMELWLSILFLTAIDTQGVRKFIVRKKDSSAPGLNVWIFTPDLSVSTSSVQIEHTPLRVMKVMYRPATVKTKEEQQRLNREVLLEGEIELHSDELAELEALLQKSADLLPWRTDARTFQDWQIGLLRRFTAEGT